MAKNKKTTKAFVPEPPASSAPLSAEGKALVGAGGALVVLGFVVLSFSDPLGRNVPSVVSPFLLLAGYAAIGLGLFLPADPPSPPAP